MCATAKGVPAFPCCQYNNAVWWMLTVSVHSTRHPTPFSLFSTDSRCRGGRGGRAWPSFRFLDTAADNTRGKLLGCCSGSRAYLSSVSALLIYIIYKAQNLDRKDLVCLFVVIIIEVFIKAQNLFRKDFFFFFFLVIIIKVSIKSKILFVTRLLQAHTRTQTANRHSHTRA